MGEADLAGVFVGEFLEGEGLHEADVFADCVDVVGFVTGPAEGNRFVGLDFFHGAGVYGDDMGLLGGRLQKRRQLVDEADSGVVDA